MDDSVREAIRKRLAEGGIETFDVVESDTEPPRVRVLDPGSDTVIASWEVNGHDPEGRMLLRKLD